MAKVNKDDGNALYLDGGGSYTFVKTHPANTLNGLILSHIFYFIAYLNLSGLPCGLDAKESACSAGYLGFIPGSRRSPGEGNGYPFQYSCLANSMDRGARRATVYGLRRIRRD